MIIVKGFSRFDISDTIVSDIASLHSLGHTSKQAVGVVFVTLCWYDS